MSSAQLPITPMSEFLCQRFPGLVVTDRKFVDPNEAIRFEISLDNPIDFEEIQTAIVNYWSLRGMIVLPHPDGDDFYLVGSPRDGMVAISGPFDTKPRPELLISAEFY